jgi:DNA-binding LacI/PurR family transcriptional regulator
VREPLVERVRRAVEELGYVPNQAARSLVTRRHDAVAVVVAEPETRVFADPFFALQLRGISKELTAHDNQLVLLLSRRRPCRRGAGLLAAPRRPAARTDPPGRHPDRVRRASRLE